ncbi:MAG: glycosyl hydrolase family 79 C-terminal domain-containing protein [Solirubrobacteraceae bacterium]
MPVWLRARSGGLIAIVLMVSAFGLLGPRSSDAVAHRVDRHGGVAPQTSPPTVVTVDPQATENRIAAGFLGLSFEYWAAANYAGKNPNAVDPVLVQLIRNLMPNGDGSLRIGGVTTDWTWWPVHGVAQPGGVNYTLTTSRLEVLGALARAVGARLILGLNLEADNPAVATAEERAMLRVIGRQSIEAFELGNEPELYSSFPWYYAADGDGVTGRSSEWDFSVFNRDYERIAAALGPVSLAGPTIGDLSWVDLSQFLASEPRISLVTLHRYPTWGCFNSPSSDTYPTMSNLLSEFASDGLAESLAPFVAIAHAHHLKLRNDEMNSVSCGTANGVANVFGSALWSLDALFQMARVGVDGVNIHTAPTYPDRLFVAKKVHHVWRAAVEPEYYGLMMFAQAAPAGSRLVHVSGASGDLRAWATRATDGVIRVVLINDDTTRAQTLAVRVPGARGAAGLERLEAPSVEATSGVTIGGQTFGAETTTGALPTVAPVAVVPRAGDYDVRMPAASAAMLTLTPN